MKKLIIFMFFIFFTYSATFAEELIPIDAVLVLDVSRSMATADPNKISREAMHLFTEKLSENRDRVGIIAYAGNVERVFALQKIDRQGDVEGFPDSSNNDREILRKFIDGLEYASWTDHGIGLQEAIQMFSEIYPPENEPRQGIIVFLTDGNMNVNPWGARTNEQAQDDVNNAVSTAREMNIPIHVIGLNFDGNLDWQPIELIADATNGLAFETANADELPSIIDAFFNEMIAAPQTRTENITPTPEPPEEILLSFEELLEEHSEEFLAEPFDELLDESLEELEIVPPEIPEEISYVKRNIFIIGFVLIILAFSFAKIRKPKRVFTGKIFLEVQGVPLTLDLIAYGNRVSLGTLIMATSENDAFNDVILTPSPTAPSHLPQLQINCKNRSVKFTKDFMEQDISKGISIASGTEITVSTDNFNVRMKYC